MNLSIKQICPSCGIEYVDYPGFISTCQRLQEAVKLLKKTSNIINDLKLYEATERIDDFLRRNDL